MNEQLASQNVTMVVFCAVSRALIPVFIANSAEVVGTPLAYFAAGGVTVGAGGLFLNKVGNIYDQARIGIFGPKE